MNAPVMAGCLGAPRPLSCLAKRCPPARNVRDTRSLARYTPSPRTGSGIHRTAKATADAPAEPWMPEHVRPDGRRFPVRPRRREPSISLLPGLPFYLALDSRLRETSAKVSKPPRRRPGPSREAVVTDCKASPNWTPACAGVVREQVRLLLSQRSREGGSPVSKQNNGLRQEEPGLPAFAGALRASVPPRRADAKI